MARAGEARRAVAVALALVVSACGGSSSTQLALSVMASPQLNLNQDQQPSPVVVRIYDLKSTDTFSSAAFFDLYDDDVVKLGGDLLGRKEIAIQPGKTVSFDREASPDMKAIGVLAAFRVIGTSGWRAWTPVDSGDKNTVVITLDPNTVAVSRKKSSFLWIF